MALNLAALRKKAQNDRSDIKSGDFDKDKRKQERLQNLRDDSNMIRDALGDVVQDCIVRYISRSYDPEEYHEFNIWNPQREECLKHLPLKSNIKASTFFTGFWDVNSLTHNSDLWEEAGIDLMLEELNKVLDPVRLIDISDSGRSFNFVLQCQVPASDQEGVEEAGNTEDVAVDNNDKRNNESYPAYSDS